MHGTNPTATAGRRHALDLDACPAGQSRHLQGCTGWWRLLEITPVRLVHLGEIAEVREIEVRLHHVIERGAGRRENCFHVLHHALGLRDDVTLHELAGRGVDGNLARDEDERFRCHVDRLAVGTDRSRRLRALHGDVRRRCRGRSALDRYTFDCDSCAPR